jgi:hypothetical protein
MSSLDRAITLVQVNDISMVVSEKLDLNVLGLVEETLNKDGSVAKSRFGLGSGSLEGVFQAFLFPHDSHTTSATSVSCLDDDGKPYSSVNFLTSSNLSTAPSVPGTTGTPALMSNSSGRDFVTECIDDFGRGADELQIED